MEVSYCLVRKEIWDWYWDSWLQGNLKWVHLQIFIAISILLIFLDYRFGTISYFTALKIIVTFTAFFLLAVSCPQIMYKPQRRCLKISESGFHTTIAKYDKSLGWDKVDSLHFESDWIKITGTNKNAMLIPARAFKSQEDMRAFFYTANEFFFRAKNA